jgi:type VI secretion system protein ImpE
LREQALEQAPTSKGQIDGQPFAWIADADTRLGPMLEAVINGKYYWLPWNRLAQVDIDPPQDLRDAVWMPAHFQFTNGGEVVGLIPTRYPDTDLKLGDRLALARSTDWREASPGAFVGQGQRLIVTDQTELGLMDVRSVTIEAEDSVGVGAEVSAV